MLYTPRKAGVVCTADFTVVGVIPGTTILRCTRIYHNDYRLPEITFTYDMSRFQKAKLRVGEELFDSCPIMFGTERSWHKPVIQESYTALVSINPERTCPFIQVISSAVEYAKVRDANKPLIHNWKDRNRFHPRTLFYVQIIGGEKIQGVGQEIVDHAFKRFKDPVDTLKHAKWGMNQTGYYRSLDLCPLLPRPSKQNN